MSRQPPIDRRVFLSTKNLIDISPALGSWLWRIVGLLDGLRVILFDATLQFMTALSDKGMGMRILVPVIVALLLPSVVCADPIDGLVSKLQARSFKVRVQAALLLGAQKKQNSRVVKPLIRSLKDRHRSVRVASAMALGRLRDVSALPALSAALEDDDRNVVQSAAKAMKKVSDAFGKSRGPFRESHYNITIAGLRDHSGNGYTGTFKDTVLERLLGLELKNLTVGADASFDDNSDSKARRPVLLDLSGHIKELSEKKCRLKIVLALRPGGFVVQTWKFDGRGKGMDKALQAAVSKAVRKLMIFLGQS